MRGDRPYIQEHARACLPFTPHARGSTRTYTGSVSLPSVYPACAGIDPSLGITSMLAACLPRMRGDRPAPGPDACGGHWFTPHARGSTLELVLEPKHRLVYPACAGIDLEGRPVFMQLSGLPRMRGDRPEVS